MKQKFKPWHHTEISEGTRKQVFARMGLSEDGPNGPDGMQRLLDFGCGSGRYLRMFSTIMRPQNIYGVDVDDTGFGSLREAGFNCEKLEPDTATLRFPDAHFDYVFSSNVIEHIPRRIYLEYLKEIYRTMKPGGIFMVGAPNYPFKRLYDLRTAWRNRNNSDVWKYYLFDDPTHINHVSVLSVEADLRRQGFVEIDLSATELPFFKTLPLLRRPASKKKLRALGNKFFGICRKPSVGHCTSSVMASS